METVKVRGGAQLAIRPIEAADREVVKRGFERLGEETRYFRFRRRSTG